MYNVHVPYKGFRADCRALEAERKAKGMFYFLKILKKNKQKKYQFKRSKTDNSKLNTIFYDKIIVK